MFLFLNYRILLKIKESLGTETIEKANNINTCVVFTVVMFMFYSTVFLGYNLAQIENKILYYSPELAL